MSQNEAKSTEEEHTIELPSEAHDLLLLSYQAEDETFGETIERLMLALGHGINFDKAGVDPTQLDGDTRFILERWPAMDGHVGGRVYDTKSAYLSANSEIINHTPGVGEVDSE